MKLKSLTVFSYWHSILLTETGLENSDNKSLKHAVSVLNSTFMTISNAKFLNKNSKFKKLSQSKINWSNTSSTL